jgi:hypothetical protein
MAILQDEYVKYDSEKHYYYLTETGAIHYTGKQHIVNLWKNPQWRLKNMGELLYDDYMNSVYNHKQERYRNLDHIEYEIYLNEKGEREAIIRALALFAIAADDNDLDIDVMSDEKLITKSIQKPLRRVGLYFRGEYSGYVDADVWRVDY